MSNVIVFITNNVRANTARRTTVCFFYYAKDFNHILYKKFESELQYNGDNFCVSQCTKVYYRYGIGSTGKS